jgi:UDP-glucose 4-epimerase
MNSDTSTSNNSPLTSDKLTYSWLITGGCGFIGRNLIKRLITERIHKIRVLDNLAVGTEDDLSKVCDFNIFSSSLLTHSFSPKSPCELVVGDILDADLTKKVSEGIDIIVHLAANTGVGSSVEDPRVDLEANVLGTFNMLEAARKNKVSRFVFASSGAPVGECKPPIHEELPPHPVSPYGASKLAGEGYCSAYYRTFGLDTVVLRFGNVYGPLSRHKNSVIAKFIKQAMSGETLEIYGDGTQTRDFIYIDDLIDAIYKAAILHHKKFLNSSLSYDIGGEIFQIATNKETTVGEMVEFLLPILNKAGIAEIKVIHGEKRLGDVCRNYSDTTKARQVLGWYSKNSLNKGIKCTVNWFVNN